MIGSRFNAPGPVRRLLLGPNWRGKLPDGFVGADIVQSQSDFAGVLARVALTDDTEEELKIVHGIQDRLTTLGRQVVGLEMERLEKLVEVAREKRLCPRAA
jgi:hypothetical protein